MSSYTSEPELSSVSGYFSHGGDATCPPLLPFDAMPLLVDVDGAAKLLSLSSRSIWRLNESGRLPAVHIGRATRWVTADVVSFVDSLRQRTPKCGANGSASPAESEARVVGPTTIPSY